VPFELEERFVMAAERALGASPPRFVSASYDGEQWRAGASYGDVWDLYPSSGYIRS